MKEISGVPFDTVVEVYKQHVIPMFRTAGQDLIELADLQPGERVLDVGTGPGVAAFLAARKVAPDGSVVGIDISEVMLDAARTQAEKEKTGVEFRQGDAEELAFPESSFDVVLSCLGIGNTDPAKSLPSILRVRRVGGRLVLSQWKPAGQAAMTFYQLLQKRRVAQPAPRLERLRENDFTARPWYNSYSSPTALTALLEEYGFQDIRVERREYTTVFENSDAYLDMSISFPLALAEFRALSPGNQRMFRHEFNAAMAPFRGPNRTIVSKDIILFAVATA